MSKSDIRPLKESGEHSYHRRAFSHNYHAPFIYHLILKKASACETFGSIEGDARIAPGNPGCARINESPLGRIIAKSLLHLPYQFPIIKLHQFCVMPDHVHILLQILFRSDKHLDFYIDSLKERIAEKYSELIGDAAGKELKRHAGKELNGSAGKELKRHAGKELNGGTGKELKRHAGKELIGGAVRDEEIFEQGYCDKPLYDNRSLDGLFRYIRENPHRLAMRRQFPQFFRRVRKLRIGEAEYEAYGNLFLLRNPDKEAVKISRSFTPQESEQKRNAWLCAASEGTILVSPFISKAEKSIRSEAETLGAKIILIIHEAFHERYKPANHDFALCEEGRLLIISLGYPSGSELTRKICLTMNSLASELAMPQI